MGWRWGGEQGWGGDDGDDGDGGDDGDDGDGNVLLQLPLPLGWWEQGTAIPTISMQPQKDPTPQKCGNTQNGIPGGAAP